MPQPQQWARTRVRSSRHVRRGAWYRVISLTRVEAVLEVHEQRVRVPRALLQILPFHPRMWSVVSRLRDAAQPPASWGLLYGVCPDCSARAPLGHCALSASCPRCHGLFPVAWADSAWSVFEAWRGPEAEAAFRARQPASREP
jgi:hypothetical protein